MNLKNEHLSDIAERLNQVATSLDNICASVESDNALNFELLVNHIKDLSDEISRRAEGV